VAVQAARVEVVLNGQEGELVLVAEILDVPEPVFERELLVI
jgi:hypothetical protein